MPTTPQQQLIDIAEARLANITVANGYFDDAGRIDRAKLTPYKTHDLPATNLWAGPDTLVERGGGFEIRQFELWLERHTMTRDRPFTDVAAELATDAAVALNRDVLAPAVSDQPSTRLGGKAAGLILQSATPEIGEGQSPWCGALLLFLVTYKVAISDPLVILEE